MIFKFYLSILFLLATNSSFSQTKIDACFEYFVNGPFEHYTNIPSSFQDIQALSDWYNPTDAHPNVLFSPTILGGPQTGVNGIGVTPLPPNASYSFIGLGISTPISDLTPKVSYIATNLNVPLEPGVSYDFEFYVGNAGEGFEGGDYLGSVSLLGCDGCNLPLPGEDCKEDELILLGKKQINIGEGIWFPNKLVFSFTPSTSISQIIIGPSCDPWPTGDPDGVYYILFDDVCIKKTVSKPMPTTPNINSKIDLKKSKPLKRKKF